jgi:hypothetical protein
MEMFGICAGVVLLHRWTEHTRGGEILRWRQGTAVLLEQTLPCKTFAQYQRDALGQTATRGFERWHI